MGGLIDIQQNGLECVIHDHNRGHLVTKVRCKGLPDIDRGDFRCRCAVDSSSYFAQCVWSFGWCQSIFEGWDLAEMLARWTQLWVAPVSLWESVAQVRGWSPTHEAIHLQLPFTETCFNISSIMKSFHADMILFFRWWRKLRDRLFGCVQFPVLRRWDLHIWQWPYNWSLACV